MSMEVKGSPHICGCVGATNVGLTSNHMIHCDIEVGNPIICYKSDPPNFDVQEENNLLDYFVDEHAFKRCQLGSNSCQQVSDYGFSCQSIDFHTIDP